MELVQCSKMDQDVFDQLCEWRQASVEGAERSLKRRITSDEFKYFQVTGGDATSVVVTISGSLVEELIALRTDGYVDPATRSWVVRAPDPK